MTPSLTFSGFKFFALPLKKTPHPSWAFSFPPFRCTAPLTITPKSKTSLFVFQSQEIHDEEEEKVEGLPPSSEIALVDKYVPICIS